jgi:hypothetical protein
MPSPEPEGNGYGTGYISPLHEDDFKGLVLERLTQILTELEHICRALNPDNPGG